MKEIAPREMVVALLDHYQDMQLPEKGAGSDQTDDRLLLMSDDWRRCGARLEDALRRLREAHRNQYAHLAAYYLSCTWTTKEVVVKRRVKSGKTFEVTERQRVRSVQPWVRRSKVDKGVDFLVGEMKGQIQLPKEIRERLAA